MFLHPRGNRPRPSQPPTPTHPQGNPHIPQTDVLSELTCHEQFILYSHIILALLEAHEDEFSVLRNIRHGPALPLFQEFFPNLYSTPPPEIFSLVLQIRANKSWDAMKQDILVQISNARPPAPSMTLQTPVRAGVASIPIYPRSQHGLFRRTAGPPASHPAFVSQHPGRAAGSSCAAGSPTSAEGHPSTTNSGRTAPRGKRFCCPSRNCKRTFTRQGHYENHMQRCHAEIPVHDPTESLRTVSSSGQPSADGTSGQDAARTARGAAAPTTPRPAVANPMLHTSISPSPMQQRAPLPAPNADTVGSYTLQSGTSPQIIFPQIRPLEPDTLLSGFPFNMDRLYHYNFPTSESPLLETPRSQAISNLNHSFFSPGSHMSN
ncbi:uncharacterized protein PV07_03013 [Cladophialophora immunda]|uniref:C2H2-type domain-containing protein n=1 Tax=Cladophialophora immunda TaxID=569365 RepID=A0A0D2B173_9EURO|nr:uncharacterized protein PV07_03013 [Cladophialophora immunda]KIW31357.1 hypothetical protein PV07_03013 [Cladophialophora immunda]